MQNKNEKRDQLAPEIRFRGFSGEWEKKKLIDVANYRNGRAHENSIDEKGKYIVVNSKFVSTNGEVKKFSNEQLEPLLKDEIAFVLSDVPNGRAIARTFLIPKDNFYTLNQRIAGITPILDTCPYYLYILLNRNPYFLSFDDGAKQTNLAKNDVESFTGLYPDVKEQSKIGNFFQQIDRLISQHQQKHDKLLNIKKALLEKMFPRSGKTEPEIRFKGFSGEWRTERLEENADFSKGQGYSKADLVESGSPIILYGRLYTKYETVIFKVDTFVIDNGKSIISKGIEVIVPASGETADDIAIASAVVVPRILLGGDLNIIYPDEKINSIFLALSISNGSPRKDLSRRAQGKSVVHVRNSDLKELNISYPDVNEQTKIGNFFQQIDRLISQHQTQIQKLNHLKRAFLSKMFV